MVVALKATRCLVLIALAAPGVLQAHRLDECLQATMAVIEPGKVHLQLTLQPGVEVAGQLIARLDGNRNGSISRAEGNAYVSALQGELSLRLDGKPLTLKLETSRFDTPAQLREGDGLIQLTFSAAFAGAGMHRLSYDNRHLPAISVYLFNALQPELPRVRIDGQQRNEAQSSASVDFLVKP